jgi:hypothetical protein
VPAAVEFSGLAPGFVGTYQVNFTIPTGVPVGAVGVTISIGGVTSPAVNIYIKAGPPATITSTQGANQTATASTEFGNALVAQVLDSNSNPVTGATVTFSAPSTGAGAVFANEITTASTDANGNATVPIFANGATGSYDITASVSGVSTPATFPETNAAASGPNTLTITASPSGGGVLTPASGTPAGTGSVVQVTAAENTGFTFLNWTGPVFDPFAIDTTVTMNASESVTANFIPQQFTDVPPSSYQFDAVNLLSQQNITSGCGAGTYCPNNDVTRAQMAVFIVRAIEGGDDFTWGATPYFNDVPTGSFGFQWIQKMYELGITSGCGGGDFCPNSSVTRAQMAVFIIRARYGATTQFDFPATPYFTDVPTGAFGFNWIQRMREDNITGGCTPTTFCPNNPVIRGDMAIFIMKGTFNRETPLSEPVIISATPNTFATGATETVTVTGNGTHFSQANTMVNPLPGFTIGTVTVTSPTTLTISLTAGSTLSPQPVSVWVTTSPSATLPLGEEAVLPNALAVNSNE